jgi:hypothetical protein
MLASLPIPKVCIRCSKETYTIHTNWDPKGPLCEDCWNDEALEWIMLQRQQQEEEERECRER